MQFKLSQLLGLIEDVVHNAFAGKHFKVIAETLDIKNYPDRSYCFLTLAEKEDKNIVAKAEAVIWRQNYNAIQKFERETGTAFAKNLQLLLTVSVEYSAQWGFRLQIWDIDSGYTIGRSELLKQQTLQRLLDENPETVWFEDGQFITLNKEFDRPLVIKKIALITAPDSDGQRDFKHELAINPYSYKFEVHEFLTQIQGQYAEAGIMKQLELIAKTKSKFDAVALVRGGGSQIDLSVFDSYELAVAIAAFPVPVLCGLGHERNISIADLMCAQSVKTPTKAASFIIANNKSFEDAILEMGNTMIDKLKEQIDAAKSDLSEIENNLPYIISKKLTLETNQLHVLEKSVKHLNPETILAKGYALVMKNGVVITNPEMIFENDNIETVLRQNTLTSVVTKNQKRLLKTEI